LFQVLNDFQYYVRAQAHCEYENGYLVFDRIDGQKEVWRLASDDVAVGEVAAYSPPDEGQRRASTSAATMHRRYAPRGHFRPWAVLSFPEPTHAYRLAYPTLLCANEARAFLHDVRTGALVQTLDVRSVQRAVCYVDVNERYAFVCEPRVLRVFAREGGAEVLRVPNSEFVQSVAETGAVPGNPFVSVLPLRPGSDDSRPNFLAGALLPPPPQLPAAPELGLIRSFFGTANRTTTQRFYVLF